LVTLQFPFLPHPSPEVEFKHSGAFVGASVGVVGAFVGVPDGTSVGALVGASVGQHPTIEVLQTALPIQTPATQADE
jgi:hypothetical protein